MTVESNFTSDTVDLDATIEEEDVLDPAQIEDNDDNVLVADNEDPIHIPNNDFCFIEDDFIESLNNINGVIKHRSAYHNAWKIARDLEGGSSM